MSSSSLYGNTGSVTVSSKNLTTLYNATTGTTVVANVPDRNFTTLYATNQSDITPTRAYGNANVEAFLNAGTDGSNSVQSIYMTGTLTVGGQTNLGPVGNVHISGGSAGYTILTDGFGNLIWAPAGGDTGNAVPYIHFDVSTSGNNQQFTNANISFYEDENYFSLFKNGVNIEPFYYDKISNNVVQVNIPLSSGDTIDILPSAGGGGGSGAPGGTVGMIQFNTGYGFGGDAGLTYDTTTETTTTTNIEVSEVATFSEVSNVHISGGVTGQVISTDGAGNLSWISIPGGGPATELIANVSNVKIYDGTLGQVLVSDGAGNVSWEDVSGTPGGANTQLQFNDNGSFGGITSATWNGTLLSLGSNSNIAITGGASGEFLQTDGLGNLSWQPAASLGGANTQVQYNDSGSLGGSASFTFNSTSNTVTAYNVTSTGGLTVQRAYEPFTSTGTGLAGTVNIDVLTQSIYYFTANATSDGIINFRGNSSVTLDSILPVNHSMNLVVLNTVGSTAYFISGITIDGNSTSIKYVNGNDPSVLTLLTSCKQSYSYNILKTAANTYTVLASLTEYQ